MLFFVKGSIYAQGVDNPPPQDSLALVFSGIDWGGPFSSPQDYPNAKHITNVMVGSYYTPAIIWETWTSWNKQSLFSYWDDMYKFWSYPDSFTSNQGQDTGRGNIWADSHGNLHFAWHQAGNPDGYEIFYTRAILDTSAGMIQYYVERPAVMISETNGIEESNPAMCLNNDNPYVVWISGNVLYWNHSTDGGATWVGEGTAFADTMLGSWILPCIAPDPTSGDVWVATNYDVNGSSSMDIVAFHYLFSSGVWEKEVAAVSPDTFPYGFPAISVDYNGAPGIVFQRNQGSSAYVGPYGLLLFTRKVSGAWIPPETLRCSPDPQTDETSGWPSVGITETNEIYLTFTQDSSGSGYQVFYSKIVPEQGIYNVPRGIVSVDNNDSLTGGIFPHMTYNFPDTGAYAGPGITWCTLSNGAPPANCYYKHMPLIPTPPGVEEKNTKLEIGKWKLTAHPNPFTTKTVIRFSLDSEVLGTEGQVSGGRRGTSTYNLTPITLCIYDASGRLVRSFSLFTPHSSLFSSVTWDGKNDAGHKVKSGVYFLKLKVGEKMLSRKVILLE